MAQTTPKHHAVHDIEAAIKTVLAPARARAEFQGSNGHSARLALAVMPSFMRAFDELRMKMFEASPQSQDGSEAFIEPEDVNTLLHAVNATMTNMVSMVVQSVICCQSEPERTCENCKAMRDSLIDAMTKHLNKSVKTMGVEMKNIGTVTIE